MRFLQMNRDYLEKEESNWYSLEELSKMTGYTPDYICKEVFLSMGKIPQVHSKLGGYHNTQKFYDEYVLKAIKVYQLKEQESMINTEQANQSTANILSKAEQMMDLQVIAESGNVDAMKQFMNRMVAYTEAKAETKRLQAANTQLLIENDKLRHAVCDAYNEGYEKDRCKINYMYEYDIY